jgi:hypothetical protein
VPALVRLVLRPNFELTFGLALLLPIGGGLAGCSYTFVQPLSPAHHPGDRADCTTDPTAPIVDSAVALVYAGSSAYVATRDNVAYKGLAVTAGLLNTAIWLSSAIYGYVEIGQCRAARADAAAEPFWQRRLVPIMGLPRSP